MRRLFITLGMGILSITASYAAMAVNLVEAYRDAIKNDPTFLEARADYLASKEATSQARSALLPQINVQANSLNQGSSSTFSPTSLTINVNQVVFSWAAFKTLSEARSSVREAAATFAAAEQDVMLRLSAAYFAVVQARDILNYTGMQRDATFRQLKALEERHRLGHSTITDVDQARGAYDTARAQYVTAEIELYNSMEELSKITGKHYSKLATLKDNFPLIRPVPQDESVWAKRAERQNLRLMAAKLGVITAKRAISAAKGAYVPVIQATGVYNSAVAPDITGQNRTTYGLNLNYDAFQGGLTMSQVRESQAEYQKALAARRAAYYDAIANSQSAYIGVLAGVNQVKAGRAAVKSNYAALKHTEEGFVAGTQTVLDVLQTQTRLFEAQIAYARDRVTYVLSIVQLEQAAGTLSPSTIGHLNKWLTHLKKIPEATRKKLKKTKYGTKKEILKVPDDKQSLMKRLQKKLHKTKKLVQKDLSKLRNDIAKLPPPQAAKVNLLPQYRKKIRPIAPPISHLDKTKYKYVTQSANAVRGKRAQSVHLLAREAPKLRTMHASTLPGRNLATTLPKPAAQSVRHARRKTSPTLFRRNASGPKLPAPAVKSKLAKRPHLPKPSAHRQTKIRTHLSQHNRSLPLPKHTERHESILPRPAAHTKPRKALSLPKPAQHLSKQKSRVALPKPRSHQSARLTPKNKAKTISLPKSRLSHRLQRRLPKNTTHHAHKSNPNEPIIPLF